MRCPEKVSTCQQAFGPVLRQSQIGEIGLYSIVNKIMPIPGKVIFKDVQLVTVRLKATHPLANPVLTCLSRMLAEF